MITLQTIHKCNHIVSYATTYLICGGHKVRKCLLNVGDEGRVLSSVVPEELAVRWVAQLTGQIGVLYLQCQRQTLIPLQYGTVRVTCQPAQNSFVQSYRLGTPGKLGSMQGFTIYSVLIGWISIFQHPVMAPDRQKSSKLSYI